MDYRSAVLTVNNFEHKIFPFLQQSILLALHVYQEKNIYQM